LPPVDNISSMLGVYEEKLSELRCVELVAATNVYRSRDVKLDGYT